MKCCCDWLEYNMYINIRHRLWKGFCLILASELSVDGGFGCLARTDALSMLLLASRDLSSSTSPAGDYRREEDTSNNFI